MIYVLNIIQTLSCDLNLKKKKLFYEVFLAYQSSWEKGIMGRFYCCER